MTTDPQTGRSPESLEAENVRLRAKITELERSRRHDEYDDYHEPRHRRRRYETEDSLRDIPSHAADTFDRLTRGFAFAFVEQLQAGVDAVNAFTKEVFGSSPRRGRIGPEEGDRDRGEFRRNRTLRYEETDRTDYQDEPERRAANNVVDLAYGMAQGIHETLDMPRRAVDRFYEAYQEEEDEPGPAAREASSRDRSRRVVKEKEETVTPRGRRTKSESVTERET